jgi:hypothetical protein
MMSRLYRNGFLSLRVWINTGVNGGTTSSIHWAVNDHTSKRSHAVVLDGFTWNGELDHPRRAVILAMDRLSQLLDTLPPLPVSPSSNTANRNNSD